MEMVKGMGSGKSSARGAALSAHSS